MTGKGPVFFLHGPNSHAARLVRGEVRTRNRARARLATYELGKRHWLSTAGGRKARRAPATRSRRSGCLGRCTRGPPGCCTRPMRPSGPWRSSGATSAWRSAARSPGCAGPWTGRRAPGLSVHFVYGLRSSSCMCARFVSACHSRACVSKTSRSVPLAAMFLFGCSHNARGGGEGGRMHAYP